MKISKNQEMSTCNKCGENYKIPKYSINLGYMKFCGKCLKNASKKLEEISTKEYMQLQAKQLGL